MNPNDKPLRWLHGQVKSPPFSLIARLEAGWLLRRLQQGENLGMPRSRPLPSIGPRCHELRIRDQNINWRIIYRIDSDRILIVEVFGKKTQRLPAKVVAVCKERLAKYDKARKTKNR